jgi:cobalamin biosynthesis protein CobT
LETNMADDLSQRMAQMGLMQQSTEENDDQPRVGFTEMDGEGEGEGEGGEGEGEGETGEGEGEGEGAFDYDSDSDDMDDDASSEGNVMARARAQQAADAYAAERALRSGDANENEWVQRVQACPADQLPAFIEVGIVITDSSVNTAPRTCSLTNHVATGFSILSSKWASRLLPIDNAA